MADGGRPGLGGPAHRQRFERGMVMEIILSIDLGTTGLKVGLVDLSGTLIASESSEYSLDSPRPGYVEQDPEVWWRSLVDCCRRLKENQPDSFRKVVGVGICGQMHTQVYLDAHNRSLRPAITWMDQRSGGIVDRLNQDPERKALIFQETQNVAATTYTAPQVQWVRENQPEVWSGLRRVMVAKDYLKYQLTGEMAIDYAEASGTLLFNAKDEKWSEEMFRLFGIPREFLPEPAPSDEIIGRISPEASRATGIEAGIPVANGSADCSSAALGGRYGGIGAGNPDHRDRRSGCGLFGPAAARSAEPDPVLALLPEEKVV